MKTLSDKSTIRVALPDTLLLGEVSSAYNSFLLSFLQYERLLTSDIYSTMRQKLQQQIISDEAVIANFNNELRLKNKYWITLKTN